MATETVELGTIYLVDLVGSTQLATSVGPARADELREEFFGLLREAIGATGGDEFKNTGDGLMVAFSSASAAVACAVMTQQLFERRYRGAEQPLRVRIGLGTGESMRKDGDYFGMPPIEASRLCDKAPAGGILVSPLTKALAGRVDGVRFASAGELELKGIPEPMEAFSVVWEPLDPERAAGEIGRWPLPEALRTAPRVSYVGRVAERRLLDDACGHARTGARQVVLLSGEPGIGKTRLASRAALDAKADGFAICWGACSEDLAAPYEPWIAVCSHLVEHLADDVLSAYVERFGGEVGRVAANLARRVPDAPRPRESDPETERLLLFNAVAELLRAAAAAAPLFVVLDDVHWADAQSVALFKHVAGAVEQGALEIVATYRDSDVSRGDPLAGALADLRRFEGVQRIALTGLDAAEIAELLQAVAGHDLDDDGLELSADLAAETGGNPFFVGEVLRNMNEAGAVAPDETTGRWRVDRSALRQLPESVRDVIERRIDRLGGDGRDVLTAAAVIGPSFDIGLLGDLVDLGEARLLDVLEEAVAASLIRESAEKVGRFAFEHALINHTLYEGLGATRRARLHQRAAEALEAQVGGVPGGRVGELANHWDKAAGLDLDKAIAYAALAGEHALGKLAADEALRRFARALHLLGGRDDVARRCDLLIGLGEAQRRTGNPGYRQTLLDASQLASDLQDGERAARAALANNRGQTSVMGHIDEERVAAIERALELDDDPERRAHLLAIQATELMYDDDWRHRRAVADEALAIAREVGRPRTAAAILTSWFRVRQTPDGLAERYEHVEELEAAEALNGDSPTTFFAAAVARSTFVERGVLDRARSATERMKGIADRLGDPVLRWVMTYSGDACWELLHGDLVAAERHAREALELGTQLGELDARMIYGAQLIPIRIVQGRAGELLDLVDESIRATPRLVGFQAVKAQTLCCLGRTDEARAILDEGVAQGFERVMWEQTRSVTLAIYAEAAAQAGHREAAAMLYEMLEPAADQIVWNAANSYGHQRVYLGLLAATLGRDAQADEHFARAIAFQEREGLRLWAARAHLGWADALAGRGEQARAREHAGRVLELSHGQGYGFLESRAGAILAADIPVG